jgi:hypothetical protein
MFYARTGKPEVAEHSFLKNKIRNNFALHSMKFFFNAIGCSETFIYWLYLANYAVKMLQKEQLIKIWFDSL